MPTPVVQAELLQEVSSLLAELKKNLAALEKSTSEAADFSVTHTKSMYVQG